MPESSAAEDFQSKYKDRHGDVFENTGLAYMAGRYPVHPFQSGKETIHMPVYCCQMPYIDIVQLHCSLVRSFIQRFHIKGLPFFK